MTGEDSGGSGSDSTTGDDSDLRSAMAARLREADGLLFCTDFDGTLAGIETDPDAPAIGTANRDALETLRDHPGVRVAVISGRELDDLRERVGIAGVDYAGNHGLELYQGEETSVHPEAAERERDLERIVEMVEDDLAGTDCFVENKTVSATIHYRNDPERKEAVHDAVETAVERVAPDGFEISTGKEIIELTPAVAWDKGRVVSQLMEDYPDSLAVYIGDDTTDEAAFRALSDEDISVHVGDDETAATYRLADPEGVTAFIEWVVEEGLDELDGHADAD
ncbi:trehalose-phosphatase [Halococcus hamelinensis]|uniref:Trehalose 6-phosphate phosphatase n=1 Tax=Halococcus hamelinensis 100A6 TaxID=1132509 RepID=M0M073_9EURY|nr:trehalose-phosphatase [Halococcus hamelinensis]EMA39066.1 trehalose-phosphatase [Halococcus hamelinensis 100A6]